MAKKYYSRSEKEKLAKKLATVVAVFVIVCTATVVIGHIVDNQKMNTGQKDAAAASDIVKINGVECKPNWDVQTYLFIGEDARGVKTRKTESDGTGQSDVLELLVIDTKKNTYHKLPINRDTITDVKSLDDDGSYLATTKTPQLKNPLEQSTSCSRIHLLTYKKNCKDYKQDHTDNN